MTRIRFKGFGQPAISALIPRQGSGRPSDWCEQNGSRCFCQDVHVPDHIGPANRRLGRSGTALSAWGNSSALVQYQRRSGMTRLVFVVRPPNWNPAARNTRSDDHDRWPGPVPRVPARGPWAGQMPAAPWNRSRSRPGTPRRQRRYLMSMTTTDGEGPFPGLRPGAHGRGKCPLNREIGPGPSPGHDLRYHPHGLSTAGPADESSLKGPDIACRRVAARRPG
jgi:hypothetical protein